MRWLMAGLLALLPWPLRRLAMVHLQGHDIAPSARIGFSLVSVGRLTMGEGARIGHLTLIKGLARLSIGENGIIGNLNWISGFALGHPTHFADNPGRDRQWQTEVEQATALYRDAGGTLPLPADSEPRLVTARWMLEELRLSLFAQHLGAAGPVSVQRIRKQLSS